MKWKALVNLLCTDTAQMALTLSVWRCADSLTSDLCLRVVYDSSFAVWQPCLGRPLSMLAAVAEQGGVLSIQQLHGSCPHHLGRFGLHVQSVSQWPLERNDLLPYSLVLFATKTFSAGFLDNHSPAPCSPPGPEWQTKSSRPYIRNVLSIRQLDT